MTVRYAYLCTKEKASSVGVFPTATRFVLCGMDVWCCLRLASWRGPKDHRMCYCCIGRLFWFRMMGICVCYSS